jgi:hypothetical protein
MALLSFVVNNPLREPAPEIIIVKTSHHLQFTGFRFESTEVRMLDTVEGSGLDHGVVGHVEKRQSVADPQRLFEGPVADDITGQT